ncbi:PD-(D/E)XK nuclease family protein [Paucibacter sediminis]|uniref:PD-(D/E)XK nuclease family protein n=1 Tax=Paucibacter sediminis TaxID=3019553 RepID=A0AA95NC90_9BURK|nr:PD-(D/E)XK nuclease family protein [Paucibacter sp. S2-9]WIT11424.1 PD-(D/E)XK nuclease family protein [Paucibacter sp. S2-9]
MQTMRLPLDARHAADQFWLRVAEAGEQWLAEQGLASRDAVLLLPFAQHLAPARRAWMRLASWPPRIETTTSLASSLGPSPLSQGLQISFDAAIDALNARQLLAGQSWAETLRQRDPRAYQLALQHLVEAAQAFARHAQTLGPGGRAAFWPQARQALLNGGLNGGQPGGPAELEQALSLVALEWAASDGRVPAADALFGLRPSAWLLLRAGGADALSDALLREAEAQGVACLLLDADASLEELQAPPAALREAVCKDREELAQCTAAAVLAHLGRREAPVALIAQDRVLVRRVRALLERQAVRLGDETGWTLATTPEAAQLMGLLRAAQPRAAVDELLQWLKGALGRSLRERCGAAAVDQLEAQCRRLGWVQAGAVQADKLKGAAAGLWREAQEQLALLRAGTAQRSLAQWLEQLGWLLERLQASVWLDEQPGGRQLLAALWLQRAPWPDSAHELALQGTQLGSADFLAWVNETLEAQQFVPPLPQDLQVLITPLSRAMLRPFAAVVLPGADAQTLGAVAAGPVLLPDRLLRSLGMAEQATRRAQLAAGFVQLLRAPALTLLRCGFAGAEPLAASPLLERLAAARERAGLGPLPRWDDARPSRSLQAQPAHRAQALAAGQLPRRLSASGLDALRNCPYQFFAQQILGLREEDELSEELDKRDYGNWLHAVLYRFHQQRLAQGEEAGAPRMADLLAAAEAERARMGLSEAEFLPYIASFRRLLPRYLAWLDTHEAEGWRYQAGEEARECQPWTHQALRALSLQGRLDRRDGQPGRRLLLDYKTGSVEGLKAKLKRPLEDTQLAVYALLCAEDDAKDDVDGAEPAQLGAAYLALDDSKGLQMIEHPEVAQTAELLRQGLEADLAELQAGAALPALGEGKACGFCAVRGLCRKDDWWEGAV